MMRLPKYSERLAKLLKRQEAHPSDDEIEVVLSHAQLLSDRVIQNCDDWSEGRAHAYALRSSLRRFYDARKPK